MSFHPFNSGANALCFSKGGQKYAMICAWAQMLDYDKITMLIGSQSLSGHVLEIGDTVGVSSLSLGQKSICDKLGYSHSNEADKLISVPHRFEGNAILIEDAKANMVCKIIDIIEKDYIEGDRLFVLQILSHADNKPDSEFLPLYLAK